MNKQPATPMLEKERKARENGHSQAIGDFLAWLADEKGVFLARYDELTEHCRNCGHEEPHDRREEPQTQWGGICGHNASQDEDEDFDCTCNHDYRGSPNELFPIREKRIDLLADYFGIDLGQSERERRALLDWVREVKQNKEATKNG